MKHFSILVRTLNQFLSCFRVEDDKQNVFAWSQKQLVVSYQPSWLTTSKIRHPITFHKFDTFKIGLGVNVHETACVRTMRFLRLESFSISLLPSRESSNPFIPIVAFWFLVVSTTVLSENPLRFSTTSLENRSFHVVAEFPSTDNNARHFEYNNATRAGSIRFNHLAIDPVTGRIYAGAVNKLFQLDSNLQLEEYISTGE